MNSKRHHRCHVSMIIVVAIMSLVVLVDHAYALLPSQAPALPAPSGTIVNVSTEGQLQNAISNLSSNETIVIAAGDYNLSNSLFIGGAGAVSNVAIRGATGDPADVRLIGAGVTSSSVPHGIWCGQVNGILIADITIREVYYHPIQVTGDCEAPHVYHCVLQEAGEQFIKGSAGGSTGSPGCDNGIVEYTVMEYANTCKTDYTNGVDIHQGDNWIIRHNLFRRIIANPAYSIAGPAVLMWNNAKDTICESNTFIDCERGIAFGLTQKAGFDHQGGVIRNNMFYRSAAINRGDVAIGIWDSPNTVCVHNTIIMQDTYPNAIEYRFSTTTGVEIRNNLTNAAIISRNGATGTVGSNVTSATTGMFVNASGGDLHLLATASTAIDQGATVGNCPDDWDGDGRPAGAARDIGADEFGGTPANQPPVANAAITGPGTVGNAHTLDGTASNDPDAGPSAMTYAWTQTAGPTVTISGASTATASFTPTSAGSYTFQLTVDDGADTDSDTVSINITDPTMGMTTGGWTLNLTDQTVLPFNDTRALTNNGSGTLTVSVTENATWLTASFDNGSGGNTLAPGASGTITITIADLTGVSFGNYSATLVVTGNDGIAHVVNVSITLQYAMFISVGGGSGSGGCAAGARAQAGNTVSIGALLGMLLVALWVARRRGIAC